MDRGTAIYKTKIGYAEIVYEEDYIIGLKIVDADEEYLLERTLLTDSVYQQIQEYLSGERDAFKFLMKPKGTEFQKKVWDALCGIPYGETRSYKEIAIAIGNPKACRAVGMANNKNPIVFAIPCHRVIGTNGKLIGYAYGVEKKKSLLEMESSVKYSRCKERS